MVRPVQFYWVSCQTLTLLNANNCHSLHLHKVPYVITPIPHAPILCGHLLTNPSFLKLPTNTIVLFHIHYIPGHVGIQPNEIVDQLAKSYATSFTPSQQSTLKTDLTALKTALQSNLIKQWINSTPLLGARFHTCGLQCSHLNQRCPLPCALQCLYSRWHVGEVESIRVYP